MYSKTTCLFGGSLFLTSLGLVLTFIWPVLLKYILQSKLVLTPDSEIYQPWTKTPFPLSLDVYLFNWTNPEDFYNSSVKPRLQEVGPYRYWEDYQKTNVKFNQNGTVTFQPLRFWHYDDSEDNGDLQERVNTVNTVLVSAAHAIRSWNYIVRKGTSLGFSAAKSDINMTHTVDELLFKGCDNPLIKLAFLSDETPNLDKFGFFYKRNGSVDNDGVFNMGTGVNSDLGKLYSWNYMSETSFYNGICSKIGGSPGDFFPLTKDKSSISLFIPNLCRNVVLRKVGETRVENILGYKYAIEGNALDNGTLYPENKCRCNGECIPSGVWNISTCSYNAPLFLSLPHFYNADPYYTDSVEGLNPQEKEHEFYIVLEPFTNVILEAEARLQLNVLVQPIEGISLFAKAPKVFFPLMWTRHRAKIPSSDVWNLKKLFITQTVLTAVGVSMAVLGIFLLSCVIYEQCVRMEENEHLYAEQRIPFKTDQ